MASVLYTVLLLAALLASSIAMFGQFGILIFCLCACMGGCLRWFKSILEAIICCAVIAVLLFMLRPATSGSPYTWKRIRCQNNLQRVSMALQGYHQQYKCFPPATVADTNGKPMHSWRVLILPFFEGDTCYKTVRFRRGLGRTEKQEAACTAPFGI